MEYNLGKVSLRGNSLIHLFSQIFIIPPLPSLQLILLLNQLLDLSYSQILHKSFHQKKFFLSTIVLGISLQPPYLDSQTSFHTPFSPIPNLHFHLAIKAALNLSISLIPNPPSSTGKHTLLQASQVIFLHSAPHPHKNLACILLIVLQTETGSLKKKR